MHQSLGSSAHTLAWCLHQKPQKQCSYFGMMVGNETHGNSVLALQKNGAVVASELQSRIRTSDSEAWKLCPYFGRPFNCAISCHLHFAACASTSYHTGCTANAFNTWHGMGRRVWHGVYDIVVTSCPHWIPMAPVALTSVAASVGVNICVVWMLVWLVVDIVHHGALGPCVCCRISGCWCEWGWVHGVARCTCHNKS